MLWVDFGTVEYAQMLLIKAQAGVSNKARGLNFGIDLYLHPYFVNASSEGSGESAHMRRLAWAVAVREYGKYWNLKY